MNSMDASHPASDMSNWSYTKGTKASDLEKSLRLGRHRTLVRVTVLETRHRDGTLTQGIRCEDVSHLVRRTHKLQMRMKRGNLEERQPRPKDIKDLKELKQMLMDQQLGILETSAPDSEGQQGSVKLKVHGRMKEEIAALPEDAATITHDGQAVKVEEESEADANAWKVNEVAIESLLETLIQEKENRPSDDKSHMQQASTTNTQPRPREAMTTAPEQTRAAQVPRTRDTVKSQVAQDKQAAEAAQIEEFAAKTKEKQKADKEQRVDAFEKNRNLGHDAQGRGVSDPVKKDDASKSAVERMQKDPNRR